MTPPFAPADDVGAQLRAGLAAIADAHRPSRHPFFAALAAAPAAALTRPDVLGELYVRYQAAMHATRVMVYHLPHLERPSLRKRKLQIFVDDDGLTGGDTHHHQLARAFRNLGADIRIDDDEFGDLEDLCDHVDPHTAHFIGDVRRLYALTLGPWCVVEELSDEWMRLLAAGLARHHPAIEREPYFHDCFHHGVEDRHAAESAAITEQVLRERPELLDETLAGAKRMAASLDRVWDALRDVLDRAAS